MLSSIHSFHFVQYPVKAPVFSVLGYHILVNFDEVVPVVPEMKKKLPYSVIFVKKFLRFNSETLLNALC